MRLTRPLRALFAASLATAFAPATASAQGSCGIAVRLEGEPDLVSEVSAQLALRGIDVAPPIECEGARARLVREGDRLRLEVASHGQVSRRPVGTVTLAAVLIETWVRTDLEGPLLAPPVLPLVTVPRDSTISTVAPAPEPVRSVGQLEVEGEGTAGASDEGFGLFVAGCVRYRRACLGAGGRVIQMTTSLGGGSSTDRNGAEGLAFVSLPWRRGSWALSPSLGAGVGWLHSYSPSGGATLSGACVGSSCSFTPAAPSFDVSDVGLRLEAALSGALFVGESWALQTRLAVSVAPGAHAAPLIGEPLQSEASILAGEPVWLARLGLGVEWGSP
jgi:hypothetical protein